MVLLLYLYISPLLPTQLLKSPDLHPFLLLQLVLPKTYLFCQLYHLHYVVTPLLLFFYIAVLLFLTQKLIVTLTKLSNYVTTFFLIFSAIYIQLQPLIFYLLVLTEYRCQGLQKRMLRETEMSLEKTLKVCTSTEIGTIQAQKLE